MKRSHSNALKKHPWPALLAGTALVASEAPAQAQWTKHFRVGMQLALNIDADFSTGGNLAIASQPGIYDDGYVLPDDPNADIDGVFVTTHWGYQNESQYDPKNLTLEFTRTESILVNSSQGQFDDSPYIGMEAAYGGPITTLGRARLGWEVAYSFLPVNISDRRTLNGTATRIFDLYDTAPTGIPIVLPPAPYNGTPSGVEQPVIGRDPIGGGDFTESAVVSGSRTLDLSIHNLRFGPTLHWEFARRWAVQGSAGGVVGIVTGDYRFDETISFPESGGSTPNRGKIGATDTVYGGYVNGVVLFHVEEHGDIYAGVQFMSMTGTEINERGRNARLNLGAAFSFLVGVNWPF